MLNCRRGRDRQCSAQFSSHMQILLTIIILLLFAVNISCKISCVKFSWLTATTKLILATKFSRSTVAVL